MKDKFYNVWCTFDGCWTRYVLGNYENSYHLCAPAPTDPIPLSKYDAYRLLQQICGRWNSPLDQTDYEVRAINGIIRKVKVIANIPLDPTLPILEAGYIQDRMRRRGK